MAALKSPALSAFLTYTLKWPDLTHPRCYALGFPIIGEIPSSDTFRPITPSPSPAHNFANFFGVPAVEAVDTIENSAVPRQAAEIWQLCMDDVPKGFASAPISRAEMGTLFGPGNWRSLMRFVIIQA